MRQEIREGVLGPQMQDRTRRVILEAAKDLWISVRGSKLNDNQPHSNPLRHRLGRLEAPNLARIELMWNFTV